MRNSKKPFVQKPITPIRRRLIGAWCTWLIFRLFAISLLLNWLLPSHPDSIGGIAWQGLWLLPAFISTPFILKAKSPYALLVISMLTFIYLGASGMILLKYVLAQAWQVVWVFGIDFILLGLINYWLFILLKRLPKMNG